MVLKKLTRKSLKSSCTQNCAHSVYFDYHYIYHLYYHYIVIIIATTVGIIIITFAICLTAKLLDYSESSDRFWSEFFGAPV